MQALIPQKPTTSSFRLNISTQRKFLLVLEGTFVHINHASSRIGGTSHLQEAFSTYLRGSCKRLFIGLIRCFLFLSPLDPLMIRFALSIRVFICLGSFQLLNKKLVTWHQQQQTWLGELRKEGRRCAFSRRAWMWGWCWWQECWKAMEMCVCRRAWRWGWNWQSVKAFSHWSSFFVVGSELPFFLSQATLLVWVALFWARLPFFESGWQFWVELRFLSWAPLLV